MQCATSPWQKLLETNRHVDCSEIFFKIKIPIINFDKFSRKQLYTVSEVRTHYNN